MWSNDLFSITSTTTVLICPMADPPLLVLFAAFDNAVVPLAVVVPSVVVRELLGAHKPQQLDALMMNTTTVESLVNCPNFWQFKLQQGSDRKLVPGELQNACKPTNEYCIWLLLLLCSQGLSASSAEAIVSGIKAGCKRGQEIENQNGKQVFEFFFWRITSPKAKLDTVAYSSPRIFCCTWAFYCIGKAHLIYYLLSILVQDQPNICAEFGIYATLEKENCCKILLRCLFVSHILRRQTWKSLYLDNGFLAGFVNQFCDVATLAIIHKQI